VKRSTIAAAGQASVVLVTAGNAEQANAIGRSLVDERLAACVNVVGPIRSIYRWRDAVEDESEYLLLIKTRKRLCPAIERRVKELHSYEVPEVLALSPSSGSSRYLAWLMESTAGETGRVKPRRAARARRR
jgi:periplasmic divalent cation tolerance protein